MPVAGILIALKRYARLMNGDQLVECSYHVGDKAAVARAAALLLVAGPHDLYTCNVSKTHKLALQHLPTTMTS